MHVAPPSIYHRLLQHHHDHTPTPVCIASFSPPLSLSCIIRQEVLLRRNGLRRFGLRKLLWSRASQSQHPLPNICDLRHGVFRVMLQTSNLIDRLYLLRPVSLIPVHSISSAHSLVQQILLKQCRFDTLYRFSHCTVEHRIVGPADAAATAERKQQMTRVSATVDELLGAIVGELI